MSMNVIFEDINALYKGEPVKKQSYTLYEYILDEMDRRERGKREEAIEYFCKQTENLKIKKSILNKKDSYIISDFKKIYTSTDKNTAELYWDEFKDKYKENKLIMKYATKYIEEIMPLFNIPINIRKYIYTNNIVESVNSKVQRGWSQPDA